MLWLFASVGYTYPQKERGMLFFFQKYQKKIFEFLPEEVNKVAIANRLFLSIFWLKSRSAIEKSLVNLFQRHVSKFPEDAKMALAADQRLLQEQFQIFIEKARPSYLPFNRVAFDPKLLEEGKSCSQNVIKYLNGFSEPFKSYLNEPEFIAFLESADSRNQLVTLLKKTGNFRLNYNPLNYWLLTHFYIILRNLLRTKQAKTESVGRFILGIKQLLCAKILGDTFDDIFNNLISHPQLSNLDQAEKEKQVRRLIADKFSLAKDDQSFCKLLEIPPEELKNKLISHLESFPNKAGRLIKKAGGGNFDSVISLSQSELIRSVLKCFADINLLNLGIDSLNLVFDVVLINNAHIFASDDLNSYFETMKNRKRLVNSDKIEFNTELEATFSYLLLHCNRPFRASFSLQNISDAELKDLKIRKLIKGDLDQEETILLGELNSGQKIASAIKIDLPGSYLKSLEEPENLAIELQVLLGNEIIGSIEHYVDLYPWNQYFEKPLPETIACFVTPNAAEINEAIKVTKKILKAMGENNSTEGYQGDRDRVITQILAVYLTPLEMGISYSNPPSSIAEKGQKVRLPFQVFAEQKATCLDLSVFYASLLRSIGLNPVIIMVHGHAFPGCYLSERSYAPCEYSLETVIKHIKAGDLVLFNSTSAIDKIPFPKATEEAFSYLVDSFDFMIDVVAAHNNKVSPLNFSSSSAGGIEETNDQDSGATAGKPVTKKQTPSSEAAQASDKKLEAIEKFKTKLLNLSSRNPLLNHPYVCGTEEHVKKYLKSKTAVYFASDDFDGFEAQFVQSEITALSCNFQAYDQIEHYLNQPPDVSGKSPNSPVALLPSAEFDKRCQEIKKRCGQEITEKGTSSLVFGLGIVAWTDSDKRYFGPLLLYSVRLGKDSKTNRWVLTLASNSVRVNSTLLYKLKGIHKNLDLFAFFNREDLNRGAGKDFALILSDLKERLKSFPGFDVIDKAVLDFFPFNRYLLVQELEEKQEQLLENDLMIRFLELNRNVKPQETRPESSYQQTSATVEENSRVGAPPASGNVSSESPQKANSNVDAFAKISGTVRELVDPHIFNENFLLVERADSTQMQVIQASLEGESFILEGPPGTGKTTTITNIVALNMLRGKKILFVAEKTTAMDQLAKGLEKCGLSPAVLKFPANANGKWLVTDMAEAAGHPLPEEVRIGEVKAALHNWEDHRKELFNLTRALSRYTAIEERAHSIISRFTDQSGIIRFHCPEILTKDTAWLKKSKNLLLTFLTLKKALNLPENRLLKSIEPENPIDEPALRESAREFTGAFTNIEACASVLKSAGIDEVLLRHLATAFHALNEKGDSLSMAQQKLIESIKTPELFKKIRDYKERLAIQLQNKKVINQVFSDQIFTFAGFDVVYKEFTDFHNSVSLWKLVKQNPARVKFRQFIHNRELNVPGGSLAISDEMLYESLIQVVNYRQEKKQLDSQMIVCETNFRMVTGSSIDWKTIDQTMELVEEKSRHERVKGPKWIETLKQQDSGLNQKFVAAVGSSFPQLGSALQAIMKALGLSNTYFGISETLDIKIDSLKTFWAEFQEIYPHLGGVLQLSASQKEIATSGLKDFTDRVSNLENPEKIVETFEKSFFVMWRQAYAAKNPQVANFIREVQDLHSQEFFKADEELLKFAPGYISLQILNKIKKDIEKFPEKKSYLVSESKKIRNLLPIRKHLLNLEARYATALKPCFIMSPMQVAEFLPLEYPPFDMVVFDEASQVEPACAISALRRAKQWLIVGDSKQMPPSQSSGVVSVDFDEDEFENSSAADFESILDECTRCLSRIYFLSWHYRSKDERLISFSNQKFYKGNLVTFPGADDGGGNFGIQYHKVTGYCGSKVFNPHLPEGTNRVEAEFIVKHVTEKLRDETWKKRSYGIIASNDKQAELISELLETALTTEERTIFLDDTGTGIKISNDGHYEPLWVKPLEQVQGDERDVIYLSTGFSAIREGQKLPEPGKQVSNLGKLMRVGAERRLNVALTRAREQLIVVTSMNSGDISDTLKNLGPKYLKEFLQFLEMENQKSQAEKTNKPKSKTEEQKHLSPLVQDITRRLQQRGFMIDNNLGYSSYKIEIAVRDPDTPGRYLLAVETDGETYQKAASSRDRDILRPSLLKVFGWGDLYRVWMLEYIKSPEQEIEQIVGAINAAKDRPVRSPTYSNKNVPETVDGLKVEEEQLSDGPETVLGDTSNLPSFRKYCPYQSSSVLDKRIFENISNEGELCQVVYTVVQQESPITVDLLKTRIKEIFAYQKFGAKMEKRLNNFLCSHVFKERMQYDGEQATIWDLRTNPDKKVEPRMVDTARNFGMIPFAELYTGTSLVLRNLIAAEVDVIVSSTCRAFGVKQVSENARNIINKAIESMIQAGLCYNDQGIIRTK